MNNNKEETGVTINTPKKVLHFSDGVEEEFEETKTDGSNMAPSADDSIDPVFFIFWFLKNNLLIV